MPEQQTLIVADGLNVTLGDKRVLTGIHFGIRAGTSVGLLGPNGSGKTTLLRAISGLVRYEGTLTLDSREVRTWKPRELARRIAFVRQTSMLAFDYTVLELVLLGRSPYKSLLGGYDASDLDRAQNALSRLGLAELAQRSVLQLSGGELQRALLAQALVQESGILLLDEPTAHLDVHHQFALMDEIRALVTQGKTVVTVFHDLELAARYSDHLIVLKRGQLVADGPPSNIIDDRLIRSVFQMKATLNVDALGGIRVDFIEPSENLD